MASQPNPGLACCLLTLQANCCEYLGSSNHWMGCDISSNLYMCDKEKPVSVCCS